MKDEDKTKEQFIYEMVAMRQRITELEASEIKRKRAKEKFHSAHRQLLDIIEFLPDATFVIDNDKKVIAWNQAIEKMTGVRKEDIIGKADYAYAVPFYGKPRQILIDLIFSDDRITKIHYKQIERKGNALYAELFVASVFQGRGAYLWVKASPLFDSKGNVVGAIESIRDITERKRMEDELRKHRDNFEDLVKKRTAELKTANAQLQQKISESKQAEEALRKSEEQYRLIFDNSPLGINHFDRNGIITACNDKFVEIMGSSREALIGFNMITSLIDEAMRTAVLTALSGNIGYYEGDYLSVTGNKLTPMKATFGQITSRNGTFLGAVGIFEDITRRRQAEEALRESEQKFRSLFEQANDAIFLMREDTAVDCNSKAMAMFCCKREEIIGVPLYRFAPVIQPDGVESKKKAMEKIKAALSGQPQFFEWLHVRPNGTTFTAEVNLNPVKIHNQTLLQAIVRDITKDKQYENEMARLDRLNLIGQMAAGIGHEIRNPMTTVRGFLQMFKDKNNCIQFKDYFDLMIEELDRANLIITEFLSLAKNKPVELQLYNINSIMKALSPLITADAMNSSKDIVYEMEDVPDVMLNEKEIRQLILNFARNGLEAMLPGGRLTIRSYTDGEEVVLAVQDQGKGIDSGILKKIGTPFFTTKENGTGLGLATCYSIAARHNAKLDFKTGDSGTTFFVRFKKRY